MRPGKTLREIAKSVGASCCIGTKIPDVIHDSILGENTSVVITAADKYIPAQPRTIVPMGVIDSGNSFPDELIQEVRCPVPLFHRSSFVTFLKSHGNFQVKEKKITPHEAAVMATAGGKKGEGKDLGASERRAELVTPFNVVCDATLSACAIKKPYISTHEMCKLQENDDIVLLTLVASIFASKICTRLDIKAHKTVLYNREMRELALHEPEEAKPILETYLHPTNPEQDFIDIPVTPTNGIQYKVKLSNSISIKSILQMAKRDSVTAVKTAKDVMNKLSDYNVTRMYSCAHCGLTFGGRRIDVLKDLHKKEGKDKKTNVDLNKVIEGKCDIAETHEWGNYHVIPNHVCGQARLAKVYMEEAGSDDGL